MSSTTRTLTPAPRRPERRRSLTWHQHLEAMQVGINRNVGARIAARSHRYGYAEDRGTRPEEMLMDVRGACAEKVVAIETGEPWWGAVPDYLSPTDVGPYGVRATEYEAGALILHPDDLKDPNRIHFLVPGEPPYQWIAGFIRARDVRPDHWKERGDLGGKVKEACFWIEQTDLTQYTGGRPK